MPGYLDPPSPGLNVFSLQEIQPNLPCKDKTKVSERKGIIRAQFHTKDKESLIISYQNGNKRTEFDMGSYYCYRNCSTCGN